MCSSHRVDLRRTFFFCGARHADERTAADGTACVFRAARLLTCVLPDLRCAVRVVLTARAARADSPTCHAAATRSAAAPAAATVQATVPWSRAHAIWACWRPAYDSSSSGPFCSPGPAGRWTHARHAPAAVWHAWNATVPSGERLLLRMRFQPI